MREPEVRGAAWELEAGDQLVSPQAGLSIGGVPGLPWRLGCGGVSRASRTGTLSEGRCPWCCPWKPLSDPQGGGGWAPGICASEDKPSGSRWQGSASLSLQASGHMVPGCDTVWCSVPRVHLTSVSDPPSRRGRGNGRHEGEALRGGGVRSSHLVLGDGRTGLPLLSGLKKGTRDRGALGQGGR